MMGPELYIATIPVYRCTPEQFTEEQEKEIAQYGPPDSQARQFYHLERWYPQKYNDIIGWIVVYTLGDQVRAEEWWIRGKRINRHVRNRQFLRNGKIFELTFKSTDDENAIRQKVIETLSNCLSKGKYQKRHVVLDEFREFSRFIKWRHLIGYKND